MRIVTVGQLRATYLKYSLAGKNEVPSHYLPLRRFSVIECQQGLWNDKSGFSSYPSIIIQLINNSLPPFPLDDDATRAKDRPPPAVLNDNHKLSARSISFVHHTNTSSRVIPFVLCQVSSTRSVGYQQHHYFSCLRIGSLVGLCTSMSCWCVMTSLILFNLSKAVSGAAAASSGDQRIRLNAAGTRE